MLALGLLQRKGVRGGARTGSSSSSSDSKSFSGQGATSTQSSVQIHVVYFVTHLQREEGRVASPAMLVVRSDKTRALQPATHVTNVTTAWQLLPTAVLSDGLHSSAE